MRVYLQVVLAWCALACGLGAWAQDAAPAPAVPERLVIATGRSTAPYYFADDQGEAQGWLVELWKLWSARTGIAVEFRLGTFGESLAMVRDGEADVHIGCFYSADRDVYMDYGTEMCEVTTHIFHARSIGDLRKLEDLRAFKFGVIKGDYALEFLRAQAPTLEPVLYDSNDAMFDAIAAGDIRVFIKDTAIGVETLRRRGIDDGFMYQANQPLYAKPFQLAIRQGRTDLLPIIDAGMAQITPEERSAIEKRWLGETQTNTDQVTMVACVYNLRPYSFVGPDNRPTGILVELWKLWGLKTKRAVAFKFFDAAGAEDAVRTGRADVHMGLPPFPEPEGLSVSPPVFVTNVGLYEPVVTGPRPAMRLSGRRIGVIAGGTGSRWLRENTKDATPVLFADIDALLRGVAAGEADAGLADSLTADRSLLRLGLAAQVERTDAAVLQRNLLAATRPDDQELQILIASGMQQVTIEEIHEIERQWIDDDALWHYNEVKRLSLTVQERDWLAANPIIVMGVDPAWPPFEFVTETGEYSGLASDYVTRVESYMGVAMARRRGLTWAQVMQEVQEGKIDVLACVARTPEREQYLSFSRPYVSYPMVIVTRDESDFVPDLKALYGQKVVVVKGYVTEELLRADHPGLDLETRDTLAEALQAVSEGSAYACVDNLASITHTWRAEGLTNLKRAGTTEYNFDLCFAVRTEMPILLGIIDKALLAIPPTEAQTIQDTWVPMRFEYDGDWRTFRRWVLGIALAMMVLIAAFLIWNRSLAQEAAKRRAAEERLNDLNTSVPGALFRMRVDADLHREFTYASRRFQSLFGLGPDDLLADADTLSVVADDLGEYEDSLTSSLQCHSDWQFEGRLEKPGGAIAWLRIVATPRLLAEGGAEFSGIMLDITERVHAEERYHALLTYSSHPHFIVNEDGIVECNLAAMEMLGADFREEVIGWKLSAFAPDLQPDGRPSDEAMDGFFAQADEDGSCRFDWICRTLDGAQAPVEATFTPVILQGESVVLAVWHDLTARKHAEDSLRRSEREFRSLVDNLGAAVYRCASDSDWTVSFISDEIEAISGYPAAEFVGNKTRTLASVIHPEDRARVEDGVAAANTAQEAYNLEYRILHRGGGVRWVYERGQAIRDEDGSIAYLIGSIFDATERRRMEERVQKSEAYFRALFANAGVGILSTDVDGRILQANDTFLEFSGYSAEELDGRTPFEITHPTDLRRTGSFEKRQLLGEADPMRLEKRFICKDGTKKWAVVRSVPIRDPNGEYLASVTTVSDITERKRYENQLKEARESADAASKAKSDFLARMSHEIRTPMNAVIGMTHLASQTTLTPRQRDYLRKVDAAAHNLLEIINDLLDFSKIEAGQMTLESVDFYLEDVLDHLSSLISLKAEEKGLEFAFDMGADVPTQLKGDPLRLGQVLINLATNAVKFTSKGEVLIVTRKVSETDDTVTLRFSVVDTGIGLTSEQVDTLFQAFVQADGSITRKYGGTGLGLAICKRLVGLMGGDIGITSQPGKGSTFFFTAVFGRHAMEMREPRRLPPSLQGMRALVVEDNASARQIMQQYVAAFGIDVLVAEDGEEALEVLHRTNAPDATSPIGLVFMDWRMPRLDGIATSRRIRREFPGDTSPAIILVTAYDRDEVRAQASSIGINGFMTKPVTRSVLYNSMVESLTGTSSLAMSEGRVVQSARLDGLRVLLVEDNEINVEIAAEIVRRAGGQVTVAGNGKIAVDFLVDHGAHSVDVVLMDVQMPVMDGYEATRVIRSHEGFGDLPILAMTASATAEDRTRCENAGMNDHVAKPIDPPAMLATLATYLSSPIATTVSEASPELPDDVPALHRLDMRAGLAKVGGNLATWSKLLRRFGGSVAETPAAIDAALEASDYETAILHAHSIRGVAGNIGALRLASYAADLEAACSAPVDEAALRRASAVFRGEVEAVSAEIATMNNRDAPKPRKTDPMPATVVDPRDVAPILNRFLFQVDSDFAGALASIDALAEVVSGSILDTLLMDLRVAMDEFDTDRARDLVVALADRLKIDLESTDT